MRVLNKKYWPHQITLDEWEKAADAENWCYKHLKGRNWKSVGKYFVFKRGEDYTYFLLKWA